MAIVNKFLHFSTKALFLRQLSLYVDYDENDNTYTVKSGSEDAWKMFRNFTCFIKDTQQIWTHEMFYNGEEVPDLADTVPLVAGTAAIGTSDKAARADHVHPKQTTVDTANKLATSRTIKLSGDITSSSTFNGTSDVELPVTLSLDASKITSGTIDADRLPNIPIEKIPAAALERLYVVASQAEAMTTECQEGDVIQIGSTGTMYFCVNASATDFISKFREFTAGSAASVMWDNITSKPLVYTPPTATNTQLGGIKVGDNLTINSGTLSVNKSNVVSALGYTPAAEDDIQEVPLYLPCEYSLYINGTWYNGSSSKSFTLPAAMTYSNLTTTTITSGKAWYNTSQTNITSVSGFSQNNPEAIILSTQKLSFTSTNTIKMDGLDDLSGTYYIYTLRHLPGINKVAITGMTYA